MEINLENLLETPTGSVGCITPHKCPIIEMTGIDLGFDEGAPSGNINVCWDWDYMMMVGSGTTTKLS